MADPRSPVSLTRLWPWALALAGLAMAAAVVAWVVLRPPAVPAVQVQSAPLVRSLQFSARVVTLSRVELGSTLTGRVLAVSVDEGDLVRPGQLLVQLEEDELRAALAQSVAAEAQAGSTQRNARAELGRMQTLVAQGFVTASRADEARRTLEVAQAQQASAAAATQLARARLAQARITAPAAGRVLTRQVQPGQIVQPGKALLGIALAGPTQLEAAVDERFLEQLRVGQSAAAVADAVPGERFAARVLSLAPSIDPQRGAVVVKFALDGPPPPFLREDLTISVEVETARRDSARVVPLAALHGASTVLVAQDGRAQSRKLRLGLRTLEAVEVLEGLEDGDLVLLDESLRPGQRVRPEPVPWQPQGAGGQSTREDPLRALGATMGR
jgi:HlyD family secretion protein